MFKMDDNNMIRTMLVSSHTLVCVISMIMFFGECVYTLIISCIILITLYE